MKCYFLLRENQEFGPFTLEEMINKDLKSLDLIWIDGSSNSWKYPSEIPQLKDFVQEDEPGTGKDKAATDEAKNHQPPKSSIYVALPPQMFWEDSEEKAELNEDTEVPELEVKFAQPLEAIKEQYYTHLKKSKSEISRNNIITKGIWIPALLTGLLLSAFIIKKMIDNFDANMNDKGLATAALSARLKPAHPTPEADPSYQNALAREVVPVDTTLATRVTKKSKKVNIKKLVDINANDYKVGVFGGIDNLRLSINNKSDHVLDKVTIEVNYLKPNGDVLRKENFYMRSVDPKSIKTLYVPSSKRGVKVNYKIKHIKSHPYKAAMLEV